MSGVLTLCITKQQSKEHEESRQNFPKCDTNFIQLFLPGLRYISLYFTLL